MTVLPARRRGVVFAFAAMGGLVAGAGALAQGPAGGGAGAEGGAGAPPKRVTVLTLETKAIEEILVDKKDQALRSALAMLPARLRELPSDSPEFAQVPRGVWDLLGTMYGKPVRLGVQYDMQAVQESRFGVGVVLSLGTGSEAESVKAHGLIGSLLPAEMRREIGVSKTYAGMSEMLTPAGTLRWGPRKGAGDRWGYDILFGQFTSPDAMFTGFAATKDGRTPFIKGTADFSPLTPLLGMVGMIAAASPQGAAQIQALSEQGWFGPDAARIEYAAAHTADATIVSTRLVGIAKYAQANSMSREPLSAEQIRMIPADAHLAAVAIGDRTVFSGQMRMMVEQVPEAAGMLEQFKAATGVDLMTDVLESLGGVGGAYLSDASGGGSLGSAVGFMSLSDAKRLAGANERLVAYANGMLNDEQTARGYVRIKPWQQDGTTYHTLQFPGLPVPFEVTYAIAGEWLIAGVTPQAAVAGVRQATGKGDGGLATNKAFASTLPAGRKFVSVSYADAPQLLRSGYPLVTAMGSMLSNVVRTRGDGAGREPGLVVPPYAELAAGARSSVGYAYWDGDDFVSESASDRSLLVNLGVGFGAVSRFSPLILAGVGAGIAAFEEFERGGRMRRFPGMDMDDDAGDMDDQPMEEPGRPGGRPPNFMIVPEPAAGR